jgi:hypothetical protein
MMMLIKRRASACFKELLAGACYAALAEGQVQVLQSWLTGMAVAWEGASMLAEPGRVRLAGCDDCSGGCDWLAVKAALAGATGWL